jgi:hypothetical protein
VLRPAAFLVSVLLVAACRGAPNLAPGTQACVGFPADVCARQVAALGREGMPHGGVVAYRIACTSARCTAEQGEGTESVVFGDGTGRESGFAYAGAMGTPPEATFGPLPVTPACLGVPDGWCAEQARAGAEMIADWSTIATVTVRCTSTCTLTRGDGETSVLLLDGSKQTQGWNYAGEAPPPAAPS